MNHGIATADPAGLARAAADALKAAGFRGEIDSDPASRAAMSTDNSVYQILPLLVVAPVAADDVQILVQTLNQPGFEALPITARGGGTGTNGQSLNGGVIVDFRRHMRRLIAVNEDELWADVEPGIVLAELNEYLAPLGLFFGPETSTANRCTIGGMVGTDASGKGSRIYGKTSDNILALEAVIGSGDRLDSLAEGPVGDPAMLAAIAAACDFGRASLQEAVPKLSRRFSGYDLERARPNRDRLDWWRLLIGAEGTLGLVTRVRVKLLRRPAFNKLMVVSFSSFGEALEAAQHIVAFEPLAIECLDEWVQRLADEAGLLADLPAAVQIRDGIRPVYNIVEFAGDDLEELDAKVDRLRAALHETRVQV